MFIMIEALFCLALNIYFEARNQPFFGQLAVGQVVLNRVASERFPSTVCEVVKEGPVRNNLPVRDRCQFSFYCDGLSDRPRDNRAWLIAKGIAYDLLNGNYEDYLENATHYHSIDVAPAWARKMKRIIRIEDHIFYVDSHEQE
jgi:N-acetylmuramoyl-L-alanine amidase